MRSGNRWARLHHGLAGEYSVHREGHMTVIIDARAILQPWQIDMTQGLRKARGSGAARSGLGRLAARAMLGPLLLCPCTVQSQPLHADRPSPAFTDGMAVLNRPTDGDFTPSAKLPPRPAWTPDPKRDPIVLPPTFESWA